MPNLSACNHVLGVFIFGWDKSQSMKICTREIFVSCNARLAGSGRSLCCCRTMALLHYFNPVNGHLPDPTVPLSANISPLTIRQAKLDVLSAKRQDSSTKTQAQAQYGRLTNKQRVQIGKSVRLLPQRWQSCHAGYSSPACTRDISSALHTLWYT